MFVVVDVLFRNDFGGLVVAGLVCLFVCGVRGPQTAGAWTAPAPLSCLLACGGC